MFYIIYKITNSVNGKYYIGKRVTPKPDDSYMGSGIAIRKAIKKYGIKFFTKEILYYTTTKEELIQKEIEIVTEDLVNDPMCYNMRLGGIGGFSKQDAKKGNEMALKSENWRKAIKIKPGFKFSKDNDIASRAGRKGGRTHHGKSKTGNVNWTIVKTIRNMFIAGKTRTEIRSQFPLLTSSTIADIVAYRTWKEKI